MLARLCEQLGPAARFPPFLISPSPFAYLFTWSFALRFELAALMQLMFSFTECEVRSVLCTLKRAMGMVALCEETSM